MITMTENDLQDAQLFFIDGKFNSSEMAQKIIYKIYDTQTGEGVNNGYLVMKDNKEIYYYNGGYYEHDGESQIRNKVQQILQQLSKDNYKNEVISWIKDDMNLYVDREIFNNNNNFINLENCIYNISTGEITEHCESYFFNYQLPIKYDSDAKCEKFETFIEEILYTEDIPVMQEIFGYCFYQEYIFHKGFLFCGIGRNGKSTVINVLSKLLGEKNISTVPLQNICKDRFSTTKLYGKFANLCSDLSTDALRNTGIFKMATGGDYLFADQKFKDGFQFRNNAKMVFSCNIIPDAKDESYAYKDRWICVEFPNKFEGGNCDKKLLEKLSTDSELSGIFNWAMKGLKRLLERQDFSKHRTLEDVKQYLNEKQDPVYLFITTCLEPDPEIITTNQEFYLEYKKFCEDHNFPSVSDAWFGKKLNQHLPTNWNVTDGQSRKHTRKGLKIKEKEGLQKTL